MNRKEKRKLLERRWQRIWDALVSAGLDALYVAGKGHVLGYGPIHYLSAYHMVLRYSGALIQVNREPVLLVPTVAEEMLLKERSPIEDVRCTGRPAQMALDIMRSSFPDGFRLGIDNPETYFNVSDYRDLNNTQEGEEVVDATELFQNVKAVKFDDELEGIERTYAIADDGFQSFMNVVRPGMTGWELTAEIDHTIRKQGVADRLIFIGRGKHFLHWPDDRPLQKGDLVTCFVEIVGPDGYWVERGGMFSLGQPSPEVSRLANHCIEAMEVGTAELYPGRNSQDVCNAIERVAASAGVDSGIWHGHGVGVDHDIPFFVPGDQTVLHKDMVIALHPNFTDVSNNLGASIADCFHITESGPRRLSRFKPELNIID
jgi:Xaa-Pro aminopeptidase